MTVHRRSHQINIHTRTHAHSYPHKHKQIKILFNNGILCRPSHDTTYHLNGSNLILHRETNVNQNTDRSFWLLATTLILSLSRRSPIYGRFYADQNFNILSPEGPAAASCTLLKTLAKPTLDAASH